MITLRKVIWFYFWLNTHFIIVLMVAQLHLCAIMPILTPTFNKLLFFSILSHTCLNLYFALVYSSYLRGEH